MSGRKLSPSQQTWLVLAVKNELYLENACWRGKYVAIRQLAELGSVICCSAVIFTLQVFCKDSIAIRLPTRERYFIPLELSAHATVLQVSIICEYMYNESIDNR